MSNLTNRKRKRRYLADCLPWAALIAPGVILNKDGSLMTTVKFRGPDVGGALPEELIANRLRWNNALRRLGSGWGLHLEAARAAANDYPEGDFPDRVSALIDCERRAALQSQPGFETHCYLTFTRLPPPDVTRHVADWLLTKPAGANGVAPSYRAHVDDFIREVGQQLNILAGFMPEARRLRDDELLSYLHDCVSDRSLAVKTPSLPADLDVLLSDAPLIGGLSPRLGRRHLKVVSIRAYPNATTPCLLHALDDLPLEFRWVVRWLPLDKDKATAVLAERRRQWFARRKSALTLLKEFLFQSESPLVDNDALNKAADVDQALQLLGADAAAFGELTLTVTTWGADESSAERGAQQIQQVIDGVGMVSQVETYNAVDAWFGALPGRADADCRRPLISSLNLCDLLPASSIYAGPARCEHLNGPVVMQTHSGATPFRLSLFHGDLGHTLVPGPTGSGKSTLLNSLRTQFQRYTGAQVYTFDKGGSAWASTLAVGGEFHDLGGESSTLCFQPLGGVDQEFEAIWAHGWLVDLLAHEGVTISAAHKSELWSALGALATMPSPQRTLTTFGTLVQSGALREALRSFTLEGPYGRLLDADHDTLSYGACQTFEMESLMRAPAALVATLTYLFHRLESRFGATTETAAGPQVRPTLLVLDEAWVFLEKRATTFSAKIREWLKTLRKRNVAVVFATQSLADIADSSIASAILDSCPTRIFLPNPAAFELHTRALYHSFGLNDRHIELIQSATPKRDYLYHSPAGSRMFQLGLGPAALAFCAAGSAKDRVEIERYVSAHGNSGFAAARLRERGLNAEADFVDATNASFNEESTGELIACG